jgi:hypothetical protein
MIIQEERIKLLVIIRTGLFSAYSFFKSSSGYIPDFELLII